MAKGGGKQVARIAVDSLMAVLFVLVMASALVAEAPHEYLGFGLIALVIVHIVLNRRWFAALGRGRWTAVRVLQAVTVFGLLACIVGQGASAVVLSKYALALLPAIPGSALARSVHLICSYWAFVFAFAHAGLQVKGILRRFGKTVKVNRALLWVFRIVVAVISVFGVVSFMQLGLPAYLTGQVHFAAADPNVLCACARWTSVATLIAAAFHCLRMFLEKIARK